MEFAAGAGGPFLHGDSGGYLGIYQMAGPTTIYTAQWNATQLKVLSTTNATSSAGTNGSLCTAGGASINKDLYVGGQAYLGSTYPFSYTSGTWVPELVGIAGGGSGSAVTYSGIRTGQWRRCGDVVTISFYVDFTFGANAWNTYVINNPPFIPLTDCSVSATMPANITNLQGLSKPYQADLVNTGTDFFDTPGRNQKIVFYNGPQVFVPQTLGSTQQHTVIGTLTFISFF